MTRRPNPPEHDEDLGRPVLFRRRHPLALVYGGGGVFGIAYTIGVAEGLEAAGLPVRSAPALGTSAGSWTAAAMALGLTYEDFASVPSPRVPCLRGGVLAELATELFGDARHARVAASAVCVSARRRHVLDGARHRLADLVAASSAVPGLLAPHRVEGQLYIDGGMWSATSVDAAAEAEHVVVVAPLAGVVLGPLGATTGLLLERELRKWRARHPDGTVTLIRPDRAMARVAGLKPLGLFDERRAREVYPRAFEQGLRYGERLVATGDRSAGQDPAA